MAYNFFPTGYQQVVPQSYMPQAQHRPSINWVQGEAGAKAFLVQPGETVVLWDSEENVVYVKSADASGMPSIKTLDYTIRESASKTREIPDMTAYATKDDVDYLKGELDALRAMFEEKGSAKK